MNGSCHGYLVLRTPSLSGSGTQRTFSFSLTYSVRLWMPFTKLVEAASPRANQDGGCRLRSWVTLRAYGPNPTKAYGRFARSGGISLIRRSWLGLRSIGPSRARKVLDLRDRSASGENCGRRFAPRYASVVSTPNSAASFSHMDRNKSTRACSCFHAWDFCRSPILA